MKKLKVADLFCGAGGTSSGLVEAAHEERKPVDLTAINHWPVAVDTHKVNHPAARHLCASLDSLNPRHLFEPDTLDILWASPECTHHSVARGGKPINDQSRATAWCVTRWAEALRPKVILVENVKEFETWGPIGSNGRPLASKKGELFQSWVRTLEACGYRVEWRVLCAADYGDPTTRRRLFVYAVRGRRKIHWPEPTHAPRETVGRDLFGSVRAPWRAAREIIDWKLQGKSVFGRKKPLAPKTMKRILIGLEKFGLAPFIVPQHQGGRPVHSVVEPISTITTDGAHALARPYLVHLRGTGTADDVADPVRAIAAGGTHLGLAEPYLVQTSHGNGTDKNGDHRRAKPLTEPLPTVTGARGDWALCEPFVIGIDHRSGDHIAPVGAPLSTITTKQRHGVAQPYLIKFYGSGGAVPIDQPLDTVTTNDRFGLCQPIVEINGEKYMVDILFRMLTPKELAAAQGFPTGYHFTGTATEVVKQIGNAVPKNLAKALGQSAIRCL